MKRESQKKINKLFWAINHYVSTGDHIGEGVANRNGDTWHLAFLVHINDPQDQQDIAAFRSRLEQLPYAKLGYLREWGEMEGWMVTVADAEVQRLTDDLTLEPGSLGWGSGKAVIDRHEWRHE